MTGADDRICRRVDELASAMLDGRLDAPRRAALQRHLHGCAACTRSVQELARLGRATHNLPRHRVTADMGGRVREALQARRAERFARLDEAPRREARGLRVVAAAALLALAWSLGFWMRGPRATRPDHQAPHDVPRLTSVPADATFAATSRRVLSDLAWVPELPQRTRRPLLTAQLDLFDLRRRAARVLANTAPQSAEHELARLVTELAQALEEREDPRAPSPAPPEEAPPTHTFAAMPDESATADFAAVQRVVARHADDLTSAERDDLGTFLQFKRALVQGGTPVGQEFVRTFTHRAGGSATSFALATGFAGARDLADAGLDEAAAELERTLHEMLQAMQPPRRAQ